MSIKNIKERKGTDLLYCLCLSKTRYPSENVANKIAQDLLNRKGRVLEVYKCGMCNYYHMRNKK